MKFRHMIVAAAASFTLAAGALAAEVETHIDDVAFPFEGPFGVYDQAQLQRGFQVFNQVCTACHGMQYVAFRTLGSPTGPGFPEAQVKEIAAQYEYPTEDDPDEYREGAPFDYFPTPEYFGNGVPPDLSLIAKARVGFHGPMGTGVNQLFKGIGGPEYLYSLMLGYAETPECALDSEPVGYYYNTAFSAGAFPDSCKDEDGKHMVPGSWIAMPPQIYEETVEYMDGTEATAEQHAEDVAAFLMWAAEPKLVERKEAGFRNILLLGVLTVLLYYVNKRLWAPIKNKQG